jgi:hypothetical protein
MENVPVEESVRIYADGMTLLMAPISQLTQDNLEKERLNGKKSHMA